MNIRHLKSRSNGNRNCCVNDPLIISIKKIATYKRYALFFFYFIKFAQQNKERIFSTGLQNTWRGSSKYHLVDSSHPREHFNTFSTMIYPAKSNYTDHVSSEAVSGVPKADAKVKLCSKNRSSTCSRNKK